MLRGLVLIADYALSAWIIWWLSKPVNELRRRQARAVGAYFVFLSLGITTLLFMPLSHRDNVGLFGAIGLVAWALLGVLWLMRTYPGLKQPAWTLKPWSGVDWTLIAIVFLMALLTFA